MEGQGESGGPPSHSPQAPGIPTPSPDPKAQSPTPTQPQIPPINLTLPLEPTQISKDPKNDPETQEKDILPVPSAPTLPPSPNLTRLPVPSAPIAEEEDVGGTTPCPQSSPLNEGILKPTNHEKTALETDIPDSAFTHSSPAPDLPPYSPTMAPRKGARKGKGLRGDEAREGEPQNVPQPRKVRTSVNLVRAARRLLVFLAKVDRHGRLYKGELVERAIRR